MKHLSLVMILVSVLFIAACSVPKGPLVANPEIVQESVVVVKETTASSVNEYDIEIQGFAFSQSELTIKKGENHASSAWTSVVLSASAGRSCCV